MSCSYAEGLSAYENKGKLGQPEIFDSKEDLEKKIKLLSKWIKESKHVVLHTGAGISTSAGIPDFRGPNGVWTLEKKGIKPKINISFDDAVPTITHMAIKELVKQGKVHYVVSQNIDALHLRSGLSRKYLAEVHGNMYVDQCNKCERQFVRKTATKSVGQKNLNIPCPYQGFRPCRGTLHDTILDWEHNLPQKDINMGDYNSSIADLSICLGTTLQINPSGMLPTYTKKYNQGKLVICNLSSTKHDKKADLFIRGYVDDILSGVMRHLKLPIPEYNPKLDPSRTQEAEYATEWTLSKGDVEKVKKRYEQKMRENKERKLKTERGGKIGKRKTEDKGKSKFDAEEEKLFEEIIKRRNSKVKRKSEEDDSIEEMRKRPKTEDLSLEDTRKNGKAKKNIKRESDVVDTGSKQSLEDIRKNEKQSIDVKKEPDVDTDRKESLEDIKKNGKHSIDVKREIDVDTDIKEVNEDLNDQQNIVKKENVKIEQEVKTEENGVKGGIESKKNGTGEDNKNVRNEDVREDHEDKTKTDVDEISDGSAEETGEDVKIEAEHIGSVLEEDCKQESTSGMNEDDLEEKEKLMRGQEMMS